MSAGDQIVSVPARRLHGTLTESAAFEGRYVRLEPLGTQHVDGIIESADEKSWHWMLFARPHTHEAAAAFVSAAVTARARGDQAAFAVISRETGRVVGSTRYDDIRNADRSCEIGWTWLHPDAQRTGINTEMKTLMLEHAFEACHVVRVQIVCDERNLVSLSAIARLGATYEGTLRRSRGLERDNWTRNTVVFSIVASEWPAVRDRMRALLR